MIFRTPLPKRRGLPAACRKENYPLNGKYTINTVRDHILEVDQNGDTVDCTGSCQKSSTPIVRRRYSGDGSRGGMFERRCRTLGQVMTRAA
ncbi:hypothetical protein KCP69_01580 [Salmonella enterica subsp. enterica]|nr:hypothetical protein KCP69_01580 [Salmonella enterica subsp. enterica]